MADAPTRTTHRTAILRDFGADADVARELLLYNENAFVAPADGLPGSFPLDDAPQTETWQEYLEISKQQGVFATLRERLVQLRFPIREGISEGADYRRATRRGQWPAADAEGLRLEQEHGLALDLHPTAGGRVPVLVAGCRADFVTLLRALAHRNEPVPIAATQGASMVSGLINWDRVQRYRRAWERRVGSARAAVEWPQEMERMSARKDVYQDRVVLLSTGPYSNVAAERVGMPDREWLEASLVIRREHECAHLFTKSVFQSARNNLMDELIADFAGIVAVAGRYRADWFLLFLGIEQSGFSGTGRLENYRGSPPLSETAVRVLCRLVVAAASNLETFDRQHGSRHRSLAETARMIVALTGLTLEELAGQESDRLLGEALSRVC